MYKALIGKHLGDCKHYYWQVREITNDIEKFIDGYAVVENGNSYGLIKIIGFAYLKDKPLKKALLLFAKERLHEISKELGRVM